MSVFSELLPEMFACSGHLQSSWQEIYPEYQKKATVMAAWSNFSLFTVTVTVMARFESHLLYLFIDKI
jgi:hypothetical protein